jgi:hypothetical protein
MRAFIIEVKTVQRSATSDFEVEAFTRANRGCASLLKVFRGASELSDTELVERT